MNAQQARAIAEEARTSEQGVAAQAFRSVVVPMIEAAAQNGENRINIDHRKLGGALDRQQLTMKYGETLGYKIRYESDERANDSYWVIEW